MSETKKEAATAITAYVKTTRSNVTKKAGNNQEDFLLPDVTPWPEPVDGTALVEKDVFVATGQNKGRRYKLKS